MRRHSEGVNNGGRMILFILMESRVQLCSSKVIPVHWEGQKSLLASFYIFYCYCYLFIQLLESPIPAPPAAAAAPSLKASSDDISGTMRGTIDPLVSKRPEKNSE